MLRSLPLRYDAKVSTIEESRDLTTLTMDELHGILIAYEMRTKIENEQPTTREEAFKATKKIRNKGHKEEGKSNDGWEEKEESNFVRKIKRGTGRYIGKLPFKCLNCGRIGHYAKKCPFEENKGVYKKNNLYSKEDSCSSNQSDGEEKEAWKVLFITQETQNDEHKNIGIDETDYEGEWINYLIEGQKKTNMKQETFWGTEDDTENEQEDIEEKLKYVET